MFFIWSPQQKSLNIQNKHTAHWQQAVLQSYLPCSELFHAIFENSHSHLYYIFFQVLFSKKTSYFSCIHTLVSKQSLWLTSLHEDLPSSIYWPGSILWYPDLIVTSPLVTLETDQPCVSVGVCWWCLCRTSRTRTCCRRSVAGSDQTADWAHAPPQKTQGAPWGAPCVGTKWFVSESPVVF